MYDIPGCILISSPFTPCPESGQWMFLCFQKMETRKQPMVMIASLLSDMFQLFVSSADKNSLRLFLMLRLCPLFSFLFIGCSYWVYKIPRQLLYLYIYIYIYIYIYMLRMYFTSHHFICKKSRVCLYFLCCSNDLHLTFAFGLYLFVAGFQDSAWIKGTDMVTRTN